MKKNNFSIILFSIFFSLEAQIIETPKFTDDNESIEETYAKQSDYLVPANSLLNSYPYEIKYNNKIREILFKGLPEYFDIKYFVQPSFGTERVLIIRNNRIIYHQAKKSIWSKYYDEINEKKQIVSDINETIEIDKYENKISKDNADLINKLYRAALSKTRYRIFTPKELEFLIVINDGTNYSFSLGNYNIVEGITWSPKKDSKMYRLVEINNELIDIIRNSKKNTTIDFHPTLEKKIKKLIDDINLTDYNFEKHTIKKIQDTIVNHLNQNLNFEKLTDMEYLSVGDDFIYMIKNGRIRKIKMQELYYDRDYSKFRNWINNVFDKNASSEYKKALKNLDLSYLNLELDTKIYIDLTYDNIKRELVKRK